MKREMVKLSKIIDQTYCESDENDEIEFDLEIEIMKTQMLENLLQKSI